MKRSVNRTSQRGASMIATHPIPTRTRVEFDIAQGLVVGTGVISAAEHDDGWLYRVDVEHVSEGDVSKHVNADGQLWVCEFEVHPLTEGDQP